MSSADIQIDNGAEASAARLVTFAFVPRMLAYLSRLDITDRITFTERTVVGAGAFGDISIGKCNINRRRKVNVAVKRLRLHLKDDIKLLLEKEVYVWSKLNHRNVLPLLGYAFDKDTGYPMLISEWMVNGSAWTYVTKNPQCDLARLISGIAQGLAYLHENDIIHSDIKSVYWVLLLSNPGVYLNAVQDNVLVSNTGDALICDFGFARILNASRSLGSMSVGGEGTPQYMAYELLAHPTTYTKASKETDVWAFGVTIYELYMRKRPYEELSRYQVPFRIMQGELLEFPDIPVNPHATKLAELLRSVCARCWILEPSKRARMTELVNVLEREQTLRVPQSIAATFDAPLSDSPLHSKLSENGKRSADLDTSYGDSYGDSYGFKRTKIAQSEGDASSINLIVPTTNASSALLSSSSTLTTGVRQGSSEQATPTSCLPVPPQSDNLFLDDLNLDTLAPDYKKEGGDWFAVFNPKLKRALDVNLMHVLVHGSVVCCVRFSADGKYLATGCNRTAQIYDTKTGRKICVLNDESASPVGDLYIRSVCFSPDGKLLATGAEDKTIRIWEISKKRVKRVFEGHQQEIYSLDFSKNGRLIVSGSGDRTARIWDMETGMQKVLEIKEPDGVDAGVTSVAISPDGRLVAAGSLDTVVRIWEVQSGNLIEKLLGHRDSVYSVAFTPDGKGIVSGSLDKTLKHWDISGLLSKKEGGVSSPTSSVGPGNGAGGSGSGAVTRAKDTNGGGERGSVNTLNFTGHKDYVLSVAVSHDGQWVVSGSKDRGVQFWEARTAQVQLMLQGHKHSVISIDLSPSGGVLATGSGDMQARLWSYKTI